MVRRSLLLLAAMLLIAPAVAPAVATPAAAAVTSVSTRNVTIPGSGDVQLDARVYLPETDAVHPLVVMPSSWSLPKEEYEAVGRDLASRGYVAVSYTARGWFASTGTIMVAGEEDQRDLSEVIDWALDNTPVTPDSKIGTFGVSYGAGIGLLGAADDPRIDAVVALSGWADLQTSLLPGNTVSQQAVTLLGETSKITGRPDQLLLDALEAAETGDIEEVIPLAETRSPGRQVDQLNANGPALMVANGWQDGIFPPDQFFDMWDQLTVPKRILLGPGDHATSELGGILGLDNEYVDAGTEWLDRHLLGVPGPQEPAVEVRPTLGGPSSAYASLGDLRSGTRRLHLGAPTGPPDTEASLTEAVPAAWNAEYTGGRESGADTGTVMLAGAGYALGLPIKEWLPLVDHMPLLDRWAGLVWQTDPLTEATKLGGMPSLRATVTPSGPEATVVAYLYDVDASGNGTLLSWQPWTAKGLTPGVPVPADFRLQPVLHTVPAGHRIALVLDSAEARLRSETMPGETIGVSGSPAEVSYLDIPLG